MRHRLPDYLAARGVELRKQGSRLVGRCPVHDDRNPSFAVFGSHHEACGCYPCGFTGDVFAVSKWLGRASTFPEAVQDVAATLGLHVPSQPAGTATRPAMAPQRPAKAPAPPFTLTDDERGQIHRARAAFANAWHSGSRWLSHQAITLGLPREALRHCAWGGESGLGLSERLLSDTAARPQGLCYIYPQGIKWRNPNPHGKPRFRWLVGKATAPWRMEWVKSHTVTVYLTEGESDCIALVAAGLEADGTAACVASPGTSFVREWAPLFTGKRVVLCFDLDPPGQAASAKVAAMLQGHAAEVLTWKGACRHE